MANLVLLRHLLSQWNKENKFSGWTDLPLAEEGILAAPQTAQKIPFKPEVVFTSPLSRNKTTAWLVLDEMKLDSIFLEPGERPADSKDVPVYVTKALNERSYGLLEGVNKDEAKQKFGEEKIFAWRRSWDVAPPEGESLEDVYHRVLPFFQEYVEPEILNEKNILIVGSHNSLRAVAKYLEKIKEIEIDKYEIPFGGMIVYKLDRELKVLSKEVI